MRLLRAGRWITAIGLLLLAGVYVRALAFTPVERTQGFAQKIFYLHVPAAIWAETAMVLVGLGGNFYLFLKDPPLHRFSAPSAGGRAAVPANLLPTRPSPGQPTLGA